MTAFIGIIGGSGLYEIDGFQHAEDIEMDTPFGKPSAPIRTGMIGDTKVAFIPRHGRGHQFSPSDIPYRANMYALRALGVDGVVSVSAVGSLKEELPPGTMVVVDQFIDRTVGRARTFFDQGVACHVAFADPICPALANALADAAETSGASVVRGGTYICIEGPQFSTRAESELFRSWGASVIGMTNLPESRLAREAELPYATLALVTDYDCWHTEHDDVTVDQVIKTLKANVSNAKQSLVALAKNPPTNLKSDSPAAGALKHAVMTVPDHLSQSEWDRISLFMKPYWGDK